MFVGWRGHAVRNVTVCGLGEGKMRLREDEALRYLGYRGHAPDEKVKELLDRCAVELEHLPTMRYAYRKFDDLVVEDDGVTIGGVHFASRSLARHLAGCTAAVVLCATLGAEADRVRLRREKLDMTWAVITDAAQSAYIEQLCDKACDEIEERFAANRYVLTSRFSPGYGDFPLAYQGVVLQMADAYRRIGLTLSDTDMLTPQKSVTAIVGLKEANASDAPHTQDDCGNASQSHTQDDRGCARQSSCATCEARGTCAYAKEV